MRKLIMFSLASMLVACVGQTKTLYEQGMSAYDRSHYDLAYMTFLPLAKTGDAEAQFMLGVMHVRGRGVDQDIPKGMEWYCQAAMGGHATAFNDIGVLIEAGQNGLRMKKEAVKWFVISANLDSAYGQYSLAKRYHDGEGVEKDLEAAYLWYNLSYRNMFWDDHEVLEKLREVEDVLTSFQIRKLDLRAKDWKAADFDERMKDFAKTSSVCKQAFNGVVAHFDGKRL